MTDVVLNGIEAAGEAAGGAAAQAREHLVPKQEEFCQAYMRTFSVVEAYKAAGYKGAGHRANAYNLFKKPRIQERIAELKRERAEENRLTIEKVRDSLARIAESAEAEGRYSAAIRAWELLAKMLGAFTERAEVNVHIRKTEAEVDSEIARLTKLVNGE